MRLGPKLMFSMLPQMEKWELEKWQIWDVGCVGFFDAPISLLLPRVALKSATHPTYSLVARRAAFSAPGPRKHLHL